MRIQALDRCIGSDDNDLRCFWSSAVRQIVGERYLPMDRKRLSIRSGYLFMPRVMGSFDEILTELNL